VWLVEAIVMMPPYVIHGREATQRGEVLTALPISLERFVRNHSHRTSTARNRSISASGMKPTASATAAVPSVTGRPTNAADPRTAATVATQTPKLL
jgi:hypothetical protein